MTKTQNYNLNQWEASDRLCREDFNADNAAIDAALAAKAEKSALTAVETALANYKTANDAAVAKKAEQSAVAAVETALANYKTSNDAAVAKKAETSALTALQNSLNATNSNVSALSAALGSGGKNARIETGTYTGTGIHGEKGSTSLSFDFVPVFIFISTSSGVSYGDSWLIRPLTSAHSSNGDSMKVTWSERSVSFVSTSLPTSAEGQNNASDRQYIYAAIGYDA